MIEVLLVVAPKIKAKTLFRVIKSPRACCFTKSEQGPVSSSRICRSKSQKEELELKSQELTASIQTDEYVCVWMSVGMLLCFDLMLGRVCRRS